MVFESQYFAVFLDEPHDFEIFGDTRNSLNLKQNL